MSLRAFHIVFIVLSILIAAGFAAWVWLGGAGPEAGAGIKVMGTLSAVLSVGLVFYGVYFIRNSKHIII